MEVVELLASIPVVVVASVEVMAVIVGLVVDALTEAEMESSEAIVVETLLIETLLIVVSGTFVDSVVSVVFNMTVATVVNIAVEEAVDLLLEVVVGMSVGAVDFVEVAVNADVGNILVVVIVEANDFVETFVMSVLLRSSVEVAFNVLVVVTDELLLSMVEREVEVVLI